MTGGEGTYAVEFKAYEPAPAEAQKRLSEVFQHPDDD